MRVRTLMGNDSQPNLLRNSHKVCAETTVEFLYGIFIRKFYGINFVESFHMGQYPCWKRRDRNLIIFNRFLSLRQKQIRKIYPSFIHLNLFLSLFYLPLSLSISCLSRLMSISFNPIFFISAYLSYIDLYIFPSLCQSKFTAISFNVLLFISIHPLSIHLYLFNLFVNPNSRLYLYIISISLLEVKRQKSIFQIERDKEDLSLVYSPVSLFIPCLFTSIFFNLFVNSNSQLYLSYPFSLSHSILCIFTYICPLFLYVSLSIQIDVYLSQPHFLFSI